MDTQSPVSKPPFEAFYKDNVGLVHKVARKVHARVLAMGAAVEYDDVAQEATIVMMRAYEKFNPDLGFKFSTYYVRAAYYELNRFMASYDKDIKVLGIFSMQAAVGDDGEMLDAEARIDGNHPSPEQVLESKQLLATIAASLSPLANKMLDLIVNTPDAFEREWQIARELRIKGSNATDPNITPTFVGEYVRKLTGASKPEITAAMAEIKALGKELNV